jgi:hypothetical protein
MGIYIHGKMGIYLKNLCALILLFWECPCPRVLPAVAVNLNFKKNSDT